MHYTIFHVLRATITACVASFICVHLTAAMDSLPHDILDNHILKNAISTLEETMASKPHTLYLWCVPQTLQKACSLRLVSKVWRSLLTVSKVLEYADVDCGDLARWQCHYAISQNEVLKKTHTQCNALKSTADSEVYKQYDFLVKEIEQKQFITMSILFYRKIVEPTLSLPVRCSAFIPKEQLPDKLKESYFTIPLLHYALYFKAHTRFIELLLHAGADVNHDSPVHFLRTPLYISVVYADDKDDTEKTALLIAAGACGSSVCQGSSLVDSVTKNYLIADPTTKQEKAAMLQIWGTTENSVSLFEKVFFSVLHLPLKAVISLVREKYDANHKQYIEHKTQYLAELGDTTI